jgi:hypothetical protein
MYSDGLTGCMTAPSDARLSASGGTRDRVYGSHDGAVDVPSALLVRISPLEPDGGAHTCVAAFAAAGGGRGRSVVAIFPVFAFGAFVRSVFSMPPSFFSGLGVLARVRLGGGGARRVASSPELLVERYAGRGTGFRSGPGDGRGRSA